MDETHQYAEIETDETTLALACNDLAHSNLPENFQRTSLSASLAGIEIGFVTEDVAAAFLRAVEAGAIALTAPKVKPWGQTVAYVCDQDGILVELCSPM